MTEIDDFKQEYEDVIEDRGSYLLTLQMLLIVYLINSSSKALISSVFLRFIKI